MTATVVHSPYTTTIPPPTAYAGADRFQAWLQRFNVAMNVRLAQSPSSPCAVTSMGEFFVTGCLTMAALASDLLVEGTDFDSVNNNTQPAMNGYMGGKGLDSLSDLETLDKKISWLESRIRDQSCAAEQASRFWQSFRTVDNRFDTQECIDDNMDEDMKDGSNIEEDDDDEEEEEEDEDSETSPTVAYRAESQDIVNHPKKLVGQPRGELHVSFTSTKTSHMHVIDNDDDILHASMKSPTVDIEKLKTRGKGHYTCHHDPCTKGGVGHDGVKVVFERNCSFRAHLQKHDKTWKCDLPGCPNQEGFARVDQLKRHRLNVKHGTSLPGRHGSRRR